MSRPIYMDYHATTPVDRRVLDAMMPFFTENFGNAASVQHRYGWIAKEAVDLARRTVASAIHAQNREIIFTSGATESNNLAIKGIAHANRDKGKHIITTKIEHKCVLDSCKKLENEGFRITYLGVDSMGLIDLEELKNAMSAETILVSAMIANNEIGTIQPFEEIGKLCTERGIIFHTDATQAIGKIVVDVQSANIHAMSFSSHKMYGPKGVGALYVRSKNPKVYIEPQMDGGGHEHGIRSGTVNVSGIVGFGKAVQLAGELMNDESQRLVSLRDALQSKISALDNVTINGSTERRLPNNLNVTFHGVHADMLMTELSDIAVSAGAACNSEEPGGERYSHVLNAIGLNEEAGKSTVRFGLGRFTSEEEIETVANRVVAGVEKLRTFTLEGVQ